MEFSHINTKEQALSALIESARSGFGEEDDDRINAVEKLVDSLRDKAQELGATSYEITRTEFLALPEEDRQMYLDISADVVGEAPVGQQAQMINDLIQIAEEFSLQDSFT